MGTAQIRDAFNQAVNGQLVCTRARLTYERQNDVEYQRLEFDGHFVRNSEPFTIRSDRIGKQGDLLAATRDTAARALKMGAANANPQPDPQAGS
jgi:hypothetical protein